MNTPAHPNVSGRGLAGELIAILEQQTGGTSELISVLQEDQRRIIEHDIPGLEASNLRKQQLVLELQALEQSRRHVSTQLGRQLGLAEQDVRVSSLAPLLGADGPHLEAAAEKLRAVLSSLADLVAIGRGFLEQSILGIRSLLALIHSLRTGRPQTYDASGRLSATDASPAYAVRREV